MFASSAYVPGVPTKNSHSVKIFSIDRRILAKLATLALAML